MVEFMRPGFLYALPAVALPVLIHLLNRRRYRRVKWAAMEYLRRAERETRRRIRYQNLLLLALRTCAVAMMVVLFAQPSVTKPLPGVSGHGGQAVILIDDSASMAQRTRETTAFERAKRAAASLGARLADRGIGFSVMLGSQEAAVYVSAANNAAGTEGGLERALAPLHPTDVTFEPASALRRTLARAGEGVSRFYIITDLRAADWGGRTLDPAVGGALAAMAGRGTVCVVDCGEPPGANIGIDGVLGSERLAYADESCPLRAVLRNDGPARRPAGPVGLRLDGAGLPPASAPALPAGERREVPFEVFLPSEGAHAVELTLGGGDTFPPDDRRFCVLEAVRWAPVLIVEDEGAEDAAYFLRAALRPSGEAASGIRPELHLGGPPAPKPLQSYAAVFLCDLASPAGWAGPLERYVADGGRLVVFLGDRAEPTSWHRSLLDENRGLLACRIRDRVGRPVAAPAHIVWMDFDDELLRPFRDWALLFAKPGFTGYWDVEPVGNTAVVARFDDERASPAMLVRRKGDGLVVLFPTSPDDRWTDWPRAEAGRVTYLALLHWIVEHRRPAGAPGLNLHAGGRAVYRFDPSEFVPKATLRMLPPAGGPTVALPPVETLRASSREGAEGLWFASEPLTAAGIYELTLQRRDGGSERVLFAVNVPDRERRLERADPHLLTDAAGGGVRVLRWDDPALGRRRTAPGRAWPAVAAVLLGLLVGEAVLAWWFGNPRVGRKE